MWNSAWLEDVKWSFDATTESDRGELRDWNVEKTNYSDWTSANDGAEELYDAVAAAVGDNYPAGYLLFRHFVGACFYCWLFFTVHQRPEANRVANNAAVLPLYIDTVPCTFWGS